MKSIGSRTTWVVPSRNGLFESVDHLSPVVQVRAARCCWWPSSSSAGPWDMAWVMGAYLVIQALDGNVLVPLLFSEAVDPHPIAIIVAVLVFGGVWGVWGIFFAIPLATLVKAVYNVWPREGAPAEPRSAGLRGCPRRRREPLTGKYGSIKQ